MNWQSEEHRTIHVNDEVKIHVILKSTVHSPESMSAVVELQEKIDRWLVELQYQAAARRDAKATQQQKAFYRLVDEFIPAPKIKTGDTVSVTYEGKDSDYSVGINYGNDSDHSAAILLDRGQKEDKSDGGSPENT